MLNIPSKIYLNLGEISDQVASEADFHDLDEVTWSENKIEAHDILYRRVVRNKKSPLQRAKEANGRSRKMCAECPEKGHCSERVRKICDAAFIAGYLKGDKNAIK